MNLELLTILRCPVSKDRLSYDAERNILLSVQAGLYYPIIDGIPVLLKQQAQQIDFEILPAQHTNIQAD